MITEIPLTTRVDAYDSFRLVPHPRSGEDRAIRTVFLTFDWRNDVGCFEVRVHGAAIPCDDNGEYMGRMHRSKEEVSAAVGSLLRCWRRSVIERKAPQRSLYEYAGLPVAEFGEDAAKRSLDDVGLALARDGHKVFDFLFREGDDGLRRIAKLLKEVLRQGPQTITVCSEDLFVPWGMLYLPPHGDTALIGPEARWEPSGFLGYRHLIEQTVGHVEGYDPIIRYAPDDLRSALYFDRRVQTDFDDPPTLDSISKVVEAHSRHTAMRTTKDELASAICDPKAKEHILLFGAHGFAEGHDDRGELEARIVLSDDEPIIAGDLEYWSSLRGERLPNPLCFMMVCEGGRATDQLHVGMGKVLLRVGVGCLVGPQIDIPRKFASHYACRFLEAFFQSGHSVAQVARALTQEMLDEQATPLGLAFTLLRGVDNRLMPERLKIEERS